jgi:RNA polymerase sigma-70 factor (ECF subfamily)
LKDNQADIVWWQAFKKGEREAFNNLFRMYYPVLVQYGCKICTDKDVVDDCIQDLFVELWQSKANSPVHSVKAYLLKALKYKIFRHFRANSPLQSVDAAQDNLGFEISHDHFMITREEEVDTVKKMTDAINRLPNRQKEIIYLKIYQGLSYEELGEVMNINYQVARNLFHQSIKSLRQLLSSNIALVLPMVGFFFYA